MNKRRFRIRWADLIVMLGTSAVFAWFVVYALNALISPR